MLMILFLANSFFWGRRVSVDYLVLHHCWGAVGHMDHGER